MVNYQTLETRAAIKLGFENITNPFLKAMVDNSSVSYILEKHGGINYRAMAFGVVPFINATTRSGTMEEKNLVFRSMCLPWCNEFTDYTKRGHKGEQVPLYIEAVHKVSAIKRRQTTLETDSLKLIEKKIEENNLLDNGVLIVLCEPGEVEKNIAGLVANKLQAKYQRPSMVLTKSKDVNDKEYFYRGSMRNYSMSEIENFKKVLEETGMVEYVQGHSSAAGASVAENMIQPLTNKLNEFYKNVSKEPTYIVDYIMRPIDVTSNFLLAIGNMKKYWGQNIPPSQICVENIELSKCNISMCGANKTTFRLVLPNGCVLMKFNFKQEDYEAMLEDDTYLTCIITPDRNEWNGNVSGQGWIENFIIEQKVIF